MFLVVLTKLNILPSFDRIWEHLLGLAEKENMTIIITTHYIEEARRADYVCLFREGQVLIEDTPHNILIKCQLDSLEAAFLKICQEDADTQLNGGDDQSQMPSEYQLPEDEQKGSPFHKYPLTERYRVRGEDEEYQETVSQREKKRKRSSKCSYDNRMNTRGKTFMDDLNITKTLIIKGWLRLQRNLP